MQVVVSARKKSQMFLGENIRIIALHKYAIGYGKTIIPN